MHEDVFADRATFFVWCDHSSLPHAVALKSWAQQRFTDDTGNMWDWVRRAISDIAESSGPQAHARAATALPLVWIYRLFEKYSIADQPLLSDEPGTSLLLAELADELAADALSARGGDIFFEQCGAAPAAPPARDCDAIAMARLEGIEEMIASRDMQQEGGMSPRAVGIALPPPACRNGDSSQPASVDSSPMRDKGALRVDPPARGSAVPENTRGLVTGAFPCIFQTGEGDFHSPRRIKVSFRDWARRVFLNEEGRAMRDRRFRWWVLNTRLRHDASGSKELFYREAPGARDLNVRDLKTSKKQEIVREMILLTGSIPGTIGESSAGGGKLSAMVDQIEWETSRRGDNNGDGGVHAILLHSRRRSTSGSA